MKIKNFNLKKEKEVCTKSITEQHVFIKADSKEINVEHFEKPGAFPAFYGEE